MIVLGKLLIINLIIVLLLFCVGAIMRFYINKASFELSFDNFFINSLVGVFGITVLFATIKTHFMGTVMIAALIPAIMLVYNKLGKAECLPAKDCNKITVQQIILLVVCLFSYVFIAFLACYDFDNKLLFGRDGDFSSWAILTTNLQDGYENSTRVARLLNDLPAPYHWFELWFSTFIIVIFNIPYQLACDCVAFPILVNIFLFGLLALDSQKGKSLLRTLFLLLLPHFAIITIYTMILSKGFNISITHQGSNFWYRWILSKDTIPLCLIAASFLELRKKDYISAIAVLLCVIVTDVSWWPSILFSICSIVMYHFHTWTEIRQHRKQLLTIAIGLCSVFFFLCYFYGRNYLNIHDRVNGVSSSPASFESLGIHVFEMVVLLVFVYFLSCIINRKWIMINCPEIVLFWLFFAFGGIIGFCLCYKNYDAAQFVKLYVMLNFICWQISMNIDWKGQRNICYVLGCVSCILLGRYALRGRLRQDRNYDSNCISFFKTYATYVKSLDDSRESIIIGRISNETNSYSIQHPELNKNYSLGGY